MFNYGRLSLWSQPTEYYDNTGDEIFYNHENSCSASDASHSENDLREIEESLYSQIHFEPNGFVEDDDHDSTYFGHPRKDFLYSVEETNSVNFAHQSLKPDLFSRTPTDDSSTVYQIPIHSQKTREQNQDMTNVDSAHTSIIIDQIGKNKRKLKKCKTDCKATDSAEKATKSKKLKRNQQSVVDIEPEVLICDVATQEFVDMHRPESSASGKNYENRKKKEAPQNSVLTNGLPHNVCEKGSSLASGLVLTKGTDTPVKKKLKTKCQVKSSEDERFTKGQSKVVSIVVSDDESSNDFCTEMALMEDGSENGSGTDDIGVNAIMTHFASSNSEDDSYVELNEVLNSLPDCNWSINEKDLYGVTQGASSRYFKKVLFNKCNNCNQRGHFMSACPQPKKVATCSLCGRIGHWQNRCDDALCFKCRKPGHAARDCVTQSPDNARLSYNSRNNTICTRCKLHGHLRSACPDNWRQYHLTTTTEGNLVRGRRGEKVKELSNYCYNCAKKSHLGHECPKPRMNCYRSQQHALPYVISYDKCITGFVSKEDKRSNDDALSVKREKLKAGDSDSLVDSTTTDAINKVTPLRIERHKELKTSNDLSIDRKKKSVQTNKKQLTTSPQKSDRSLKKEKRHLNKEKKKKAIRYSNIATVAENNQIDDLQPVAITKHSEHVSKSQNKMAQTTQNVTNSDLINTSVVNSSSRTKTRRRKKKKNACSDNIEQLTRLVSPVSSKLVMTPEVINTHKQEVIHYRAKQIRNDDYCKHLRNSIIDQNGFLNNEKTNNKSVHNGQRKRNCKQSSSSAETGYLLRNDCFSGDNSNSQKSVAAKNRIKQKPANFPEHGRSNRGFSFKNYSRQGNDTLCFDSGLKLNSGTFSATRMLKLSSNSSTHHDTLFNSESYTRT